MKKNIRNMQVLGLAALTIALIGQPQAATARSIEPIDAVLIDRGSAAAVPRSDVAKSFLAASICDFSVGEKLTLGGHLLTTPDLYLRPPAKSLGMIYARHFPPTPCRRRRCGR